MSTSVYTNTNAPPPLVHPDVNHQKAPPPTPKLNRGEQWSGDAGVWTGGLVVGDADAADADDAAAVRGASGDVLGSWARIT